MGARGARGATGALLVTLSVLVSRDPPAAQAPSVDQTAHGAAVFQKVCSSCHGAGGAGGRASSLVDNRRLRALPRSEIESIIRNGMPNGMPPFGSLPEPDLQAVTTFVRSFNSSAFDLQPPGDVAAGESFFRGKGQCATCHIARGRGGAGGPDLSNIGRQMTVPELTRALVEPGTTVAQGYATARVQFTDGRTLRGFVRNEGNHVLPLQTVDGRLVAVDKRASTITRETGSAMPPLKATADETRDLIAFLSRLAADLKVGTTTVVVPAFRPAGADTTGAARGFDEILKPRPGDWPTYHGRLDGNRHSALAQITTANVGNLSMQWMHSVRGFDNEMTPLVLDGIMYITATNQVSAIDATSGREIWRYSRPRSTGLRGDAAIGFNRGVAVLGSRVFLVTDNAHLLAVSRVNGALLWEVVLPDNTEQPYGGTMAPLVVGSLVIAGVSGGDEGIRGFLAAYHADTGEQAWRFWTVPARGEPASETWKGNVDLEKGGGATWLTGTYDAETDTLFWPTGNPYPDTDGSERRGDNLYTNSILALEARTGKLRWHYQFTPHDLWDWDAQEPPLLVDAVFQGRPRKLLLQANRNGFFYVLDRTDGKVLLARPFVQKLTWASGIGPDGRPQLLPGNTPDENGVTTCPAIRGATNWMSTSFSPATRLFYVMAVENCGVYRSTMFGGGRGRGAAPPARGAAPPAPARGAATPAPFGLPAGGFNRGGPGGGGSMALRALDLDSGRIAWEIPQVGNSNNYAGTLSTAGGIVFYGQASGEFAAVDAKSGAHLWHFETQETWKASPMTYSVNGRQYVAITSGANVLAFALPQAPAPAPPSASSFDAVAPAMQAFVAKGEVAGVVTLLATRDKVLHLTAVGSSDLATGRKMRTDDIFWIASMSKPIAAAAIAILVDDGKLSFDDPLDKFLPEFRDVKVAGSGRLEPPSRAVTLRDVLTHVSGLGELTDRAPHLTLAETSRSVAQRSLRFQPGARWAYSTAGFDVLGRVIEIVGSMPFDQFLQKRLFDPLGMRDTSFWIRADTKGRWARSYQWMAPEARLRETAISYLYGTDVDDRARPPLGGAGLFSTATDIARFYQMMLNNGELNRRRILKPATVAELIRKQTGDLAARPGMPWGLGFSVVENPAAMEANSVLSPQSFGHGGAYSTQSWADPTKGLIWIVMFQRNGKGNPDNSDVRMAFQGAVPERYR